MSADDTAHHAWHSQGQCPKTCEKCASGRDITDWHTCRYCGHPIYYRSLADGWVHQTGLPPQNHDAEPPEIDGDQQVLPDEVWEKCVDPTCPPGVVRIDGQPFPLVEFEEPPAADNERYRELRAPENGGETDGDV